MNFLFSLYTHEDDVLFLSNQMYDMPWYAILNTWELGWHSSFGFTPSKPGPGQLTKSSRPGPWTPLSVLLRVFVRSIQWSGGTSGWRRRFQGSPPTTSPAPPAPFHSPRSPQRSRPSTGPAIGTAPRSSSWSMDPPSAAGSTTSPPPPPKPVN